MFFTAYVLCGLVLLLKLKNEGQTIWTESFTEKLQINWNQILANPGLA